MPVAVVQMGTLEPVIACFTLETKSISIQLPENVLPWELFLTEIVNKLIDVPFFVSQMVCDKLSMEINIGFGLAAMHPLFLFLCKQRVAIYATFEYILLVFKENFQLFHV